MTNLKRNEFQAHPFHLVSTSPWPFYTSISLLTLTCAGVLTLHNFPNANYFLLLSLITLVSSMLLWKKDSSGFTVPFNLIFFLYPIGVYFLFRCSINPDLVFAHYCVLIFNLFIVIVMITNIYNKKKISIIEKLRLFFNNWHIIKKYIKNKIFYILLIIALFITIAKGFSISYNYFTDFQFKDSFFLHFKKILFQYGFMSIFLGCLFNKYNTGKWLLYKSLDNITITRFAIILLTYTVFVYNGLIYVMIPIILTLASDSLLTIITVLSGIFKLHSLFNNLFQIIFNSPMRIGNFANSYYSHYKYTFNKLTTVTEKIDYSILTKRSNLMRELLFNDLKYKLVGSTPARDSNNSVYNSWYISDTISYIRLIDKLSLIKCKSILDLSKIQVITKDRNVFIYIPLVTRCVFISTNRSLIRLINGAFSNSKITSSISSFNNGVSSSINQKRLLGKDHTQYSLYSNIHNDTVKNSLDLNVYNTPVNMPVFNKPLPISECNKPLPLDSKDLPNWYEYFSLGFPLHNFISEPIIVMPVVEHITSPATPDRQSIACPVVDLEPMYVKTCISPDFDKSSITQCLMTIKSQIDEGNYNFLENNISHIYNTFTLITDYIKNNNLIYCTDNLKSCFYPEGKDSDNFFDIKRNEIRVYAKGLIEICTDVYLMYNNKGVRSLINILYIELALNNGIIGNGEFHDLYTEVRGSRLWCSDEQQFLYLDNYLNDSQDLYVRDLTVPGVFDTSTVLISGEAIRYNLEQELAVRDVESLEMERLREILSLLRESLVLGTYLEARKFSRREDLYNTFNQLIFSLGLSRSKTCRYDNFRFLTDKLDIMYNYKQKVHVQTVYSYCKDKRFVEMRTLEYYMIVLNQATRTARITDLIDERMANIIKKLCIEDSCPYTERQKFGFRIGAVLQERIDLLREQLGLN